MQHKFSENERALPTSENSGYLGHLSLSSQHATP